MLILISPYRRQEQRTVRRRLELLRLLAKGESLKQAAATMGIGYSWTRDNARELCRLNGNINITGVVARYVLHDLQNHATWTKDNPRPVNRTCTAPLNGGRSSGGGCSGE